MNASPEPSSSRKREVFLQALDRPPAERATFLDAACGSDAELRAAVEALLAHHREDSFLEHPATSLAVPTSGGPAAPSVKAGTPDARGGTAVIPVTEKPGDRIGRYKLLEMIGEGGCGVVYVAEQEEPIRRRVALKVIKLGMDTKSVVARFEAERQALALMDHPNIAKVLDAGAADTGRPYFVMELVRGIKITDYCDRHHLSTRERLDLFVQVCHAVQHAHQKGIIHRDLKPSNILVTLHDGVPVPKVIDFGIAKATSQQRLTDKTVYTAFAQFIGTPAYMSPEQAEMSGLDIDTRSDLYSLGVLLYELLTGQPPFDPEALLKAGLDEMRRIIRETEPVKPSTRLTELARNPQSAIRNPHVKEVRGDLDWIVMKCLEKDRRRRYETANALAQDIERHLTERPVEARPPSATYRLTRFVKRNRVLAGSAAAILLTFFAATAVSLHQAIVASRARVAASQERDNAVAARKMETSARQRAEASEESEKRAREKAEEAITLLQLQAASEAEKLGGWAEGISQLARVLRQNPSSHIAASRLLFSLPERNLPMPSTPVLKIEGRPTSVSFSADGTKIAAATADGVARIWKASTGEAVATALRHDSSVVFHQFSPDGTLLLTLTTNCARLWETATGKPRFERLDPGGLIKFARFDPEGRRILIACSRQALRFWDAATGQPLTGFLGDTNEVNDVDFCADGCHLAAACTGRGVRVWDLQTGQLAGKPIPTREEPIIVRITPNGSNVIAGFSRGNLDRWSVQDGRNWGSSQILGTYGLRMNVTRGSSARRFPGSARGEFSPDGQQATFTREGNRALLQTVSSERSLELVHEAPVNAVHFSPDGQFVLTASEDRTARLWEASTGKPVVNPLVHAAGVTCAAFSPDAQSVITGTAEGEVRVWDVGVRRQLPTVLPTPANIELVRPSPDKRHAAVACSDQTVRLLDVPAGGSPVLTFTNPSPVTNLQFSPDGQRLLAVGADNSLRLWKLTNGSPEPIPLPQTGAVSVVEFAPGGHRLLTATDDTVQLWASDNAQLLMQLTPGSGPVCSAEFHPDGKLILTAASNRVDLWDAGNGQVKTNWTVPDGPIALAHFSPDGGRVLTATTNILRIWESKTGRLLVGPLAHEGGISVADFSPDGNRVFTKSPATTLRIWQAQSGRLLVGPLNLRKGLRRVEFSPDSQRIATAYENGVLVLDAATGAYLGGLIPLVKTHSSRLSADGQYVLAVGGDHRVYFLETPRIPAPAPDWLPDLAEAAAGQHVDENGLREPVPPERLLELKLRLQSYASNDLYTAWGRWFLGDVSHRTISPFSPVSFHDYVRALVREDTPGSLKEALKLCPTNAVAWARLGRRFTDYNVFHGFWEKFDQAEWCFRRAQSLDPFEPEVWYTKARYLEKMERLDDALRALDRALELAPQNPSYREAKRSIEAKKKSRQRMRQERLETPGQNSRSANSSPYNATDERNKPHPNPGT